MKSELRIAARNIALAACILASQALPGRADIVITGQSGALVDKGSGYAAAQEGDTLKTCTKIRLPGNYSYLDWKRVGGCGNTGGVATGVSQVKEYHVGTDIANGAGLQFLQAGFMDLLAGVDGVTASDATIYEGPGCVGTGHCGLYCAIAEAAPIDQTPVGHTTKFYGCFGQAGMACVFWNDQTSVIPIYVAILVGHGGEIQIPPGQGAVVAMDGSFNYIFQQPSCGETGAPGACCLPDGSCQVLSPPDCGALSGRYQGHDTNCNSNPCRSGSVGDPFGAKLLSAVVTVPNPSTGGVYLRYQLLETAVVTIEIFNASGARVSSLSLGAQPAGYHNALWDARDAAGRSLPSGVYEARIRTAGGVLRGIIVRTK